MVLAPFVSAVALAPVRLEIVISPKRPRSGDLVRARLVVRNVSNRNVAVARPDRFADLNARAGMRFFLKGREIQVTGGSSSNPRGQTFLFKGWEELTSNAYARLQPGESETVYWVEFKTYYNPAKLKLRSSKADHAKPVPSKPLPKGSVQVRGYYSYDRATKVRLPGQETHFEFTPSAKKLHDISFGGTLNVSDTLVIDS